MIHLIALVTALNGSWSISPSSIPGDVNLELRIDDTEHHNDSSHDVPASSLGLSQQQLENGHHVNFSLAREAGTFACEGWIAQSKGGGSMTFAPSAAFERAMNDRGYDLSASEQATAAMLDLTSGFIDGIFAAGYPHVPFEKLVTFRALRIDEGYARSMRSIFGDSLDAEDLISLRALGVTSDYITGLRSAGTAIVGARQAIQLRALHVDAGYVRDLANAGYPNLTPNELVQLRALGIDAAYVERVKAHGYPHPTIEDLVRIKAMRII